MARATPHEGVKKHADWDARSNGVTAPISMPGWPKGMNNVLPSESLPNDTLRNAVNVDINDAGKLTLRSGATLSIAAPQEQMHSLWCEKGRAFVVDGSTLNAIHDGALTPIVNGLALDQPMSYLLLHNEVYYSNGVQSGIIGINDTVRRWGVPVPDAPVAGIGAGSLTKGRYSILFTYQTLLEEGGASRTITVDVDDNSSITVTVPASFPSEVVMCNVYISACDGTVEYLGASTSIPGTPITFTTVPLNGRECSTKYLTPPPAGKNLMYYRGRVYMSVGNVVYHTEPLRYGAVRLAQNFLMFGGEVNLLAATAKETGFFVSDDQQHYFIPGAYPEQELKYAAPYPAVSGTLIRDELTDEPVWFTSKGWVIGKDEGEMEAKMALTVAVPTYAEGAALYREEDGLRQYVSSFSAPPDANQFTASDYIEAEVIRKGE